MNSADLNTGKRLLSGNTTCYECNKPIKQNDSDLCSDCSEQLNLLVGSAVVDFYGVPKKDATD